MCWAGIGKTTVRMAIVSCLVIGAARPAAQTLEGAAPRERAQRSATAAEYWKGYVLDSGRIIAAPFRWRRAGWLRNGLVAAAVGGIFLLDEPIRDASQDIRGDSSDTFADVGRTLGNNLVLLPLIGGAAASGAVFKNRKLWETSLLTLESFVLANTFTVGIKRLAHRSRPDSGEDFTTFDGPGFSDSNTSFPSGHASRAFAVASVIASEYGDNPVVPPIAYALATLTAWSRINDNKHWASDVVFGAAFGYGIGKLVSRTSPFRKGGNLAVVPATRHGDPGLSLVVAF